MASSLVRSWMLVHVLCSTLSGCSAERCRSTLEAEPQVISAGPLTFTRFVVNNEACGAAYTTVADVDHDGQNEIVLSRFGEKKSLYLPPGVVEVWRWSGDFSNWAVENVMGTELKQEFPAQTRVLDLDHDGDEDILVPSGFFVCEVIPWEKSCGALRWFEQSASGWLPHDITAPDGLHFYHSTEVADFTGDGLVDLISVGERRKGDEIHESRVQLFPGTDGVEPFRAESVELAQGLGGLFQVIDIDGDGDLDVGGAEFFYEGGSFAWVEQVQPPGEDGDPGEFVRHVIDNNHGPSIKLSFVPNLMGDGRMMALGANHTNTVNDEPDLWESAAFLLEPGHDLREPWMTTQISEGIVSREGTGNFAPGYFDTGDLDGDGDLDIVISGDGDPRVWWLEQSEPGQFEMHLLEADLPQAGGLSLADLNGDGKVEIVIPSYEYNVLLVYERE